MLVTVIITSFLTSIDNIIFIKNKITRDEAIKRFPVQEVKKINKNISITYRELDYTNDKFVTTFKQYNFSKFSFNKKLFSVASFKKQTDHEK